MVPYFNILETLNQGVIYVDLSMKICYMDQAAQQKFAKSGGKALIGQSVLDCHNEKSQEKILGYVEQMKSGEMESVVTRKTTAGHAVMKAVRDDEGKLIGILEMFEKSVEIIQPVKENSYEKSYRYYDAFYRDDNRLKLFKNLCIEPKRILVMGYGTGQLAIDLALKGHHIVVVEPSSQLLSGLHEKVVNCKETIKGSIRTLCQSLKEPLKLERFDLAIITSEAFEMLLSNHERSILLRNIQKCLIDGGKIIIETRKVHDKIDKFEGMNIQYEVSLQDSNIRIVKTEMGIKNFYKQQILYYKNAFEIKQDDKVIDSFTEPMRISYIHLEQLVQLGKQLGYQVKTIEQDFTPEFLYVELS